MKRAVLLMLGLLLSLPAGAGAVENSLKWGYVDLQRAVRTVDRGKKAYDELLALKNQKQKELEKEDKDLRAEGEALKKQDGVLSEDAKKRKAMEFAQKQMEFQRKVEKSEMELMKAQNEYAKDILDDMGKIIDEVGKKDGYEVIFERSNSSLLYAQTGKDLTESVIKIYNQRHPRGKK
jgi:outer membrane protein